MAWASAGGASLP